MCYSAMVEQNLQSLARDFDADVDWSMYEQLLATRLERNIKVTRALEANFLGAPGADIPADLERRARGHIEAHRAKLIEKLESDLITFRKRLADAQRALKVRETRQERAYERAAQNKIAASLQRLADLRRVEPLDKDRRIFPLYHAPLLVSDGGRRWIRPMRFTCRLPGRPPSHDIRFPGTYNARRQNLKTLWKVLYGHHHGVLVITSFFENVANNVYERRELEWGEKPRNLVLHFDPQPAVRMLVACICSHWTGQQEPDLHSFAAITDRAPTEIAATGHRRCIIPIRRENLDDWLNPESVSRERLDEILNARDPLYYQHQIAA